MLFLAIILAQTSPTSGSVPWEDILKVGITPVIVIVLLLTGQLYIGKVADREREQERSLWKLALDTEKNRADKAQEEAKACSAQVNALRQANEDKVLPALFNATQAQRDILAAVLGKEAPK